MDSHKQPIDHDDLQGKASSGECQQANSEADIERFQLEKNLRETREELEQYRTLYDSLPAIYLNLNLEGAVFKVNQFGAGRLGYTTQELIGKSLFSLIYPEDKQRLQAEFAAFLQHPTRKSLELDLATELDAFSVNWEARICRQDSSILWVKIIPRVVQRTDLNPAILIVCEEIAEPKQVEEESVKSEELFRLLFENSMDAIVIADDNGNYVRVNRAACQVLGYSQTQLLQMNVADLVTTEAPSAGERYQAYAQAGHEFGEISFIRGDGERRIAEYSACRFAPHLHLSILRDITDRQQAQEALRDDANRLYAINATLHDIVTADLDLNRVMNLIVEGTQNLAHASGAALELIEEDEMVSRAASGTAAAQVGLRLKISASLSGQCVRTGEILHCEDVETDPRVDIAACRRVGARSMIVVPLFYERNAIGVLKVLSANAHAFDRQDIYTLQLMARFIAATMSHASEFEAKQAALLALQESEERYRALIEDVQVGVLLQGQNAEIMLCNQAALDLLGLTESQLLGKTSLDAYWNVIHEDGAPFPKETHPVPQAIATRQPVRNVVMGVYRPQDGDSAERRPEGDRVWLLVNAEPQLAPDGSVQQVICTFSDITQQKLAESALQKANEQLEIRVEERTAQLKNANQQLQSEIAYRAQIELALRESEARFRHIADSNMIGILFWDIGGTISETNDAFLQMVGYTREELLAGKLSWREITPAEYLYLDEIALDEIATTGVCSPFEKEYICSDGSRVAVLVGGACLDNSPQRGVAFILDISDRQRAQEALRKSEATNRALVNAIPDLIVRINKNGTCVDCKQARNFETLLPAEEFLGKNIAEILPIEVAQPAIYYVERAFSTDEIQIFEYQLLTNSKVSDYEARIVLSGRDEVLVIVRDITERKRREEELVERSRLAALGADISAALAKSDNLQIILQQCVKVLVHHLDVAFARIWTLNEMENVLELQASAGMYTNIDGSYSRVPVGNSKIGRIAQNRQPHMSNSVPDDPEIKDREWAKQAGMIAFAGYPLIVEKRVVGVVAMFARQPLTEGVIAQLASIADGIAQCIERKRGEVALQKQTERELLMSAIAQRIRHSLNLEEILNSTVAQVRQFLQTDRVIIFRFFQPDWTGVVAVESVANGWLSILGRKIHEPCFEKGYVQLYKHGRTKAIEDIYTAGLDPCHLDLLAQLQVRANLVVPILQGEELWGLLIAQHCSEPRRWQQLEIDLLSSLATQLAIAIQQAELYKQTQQQAQREQALNRFTSVIRSSLELEHIFATAAQEIGQMLHIDRVKILPYIPDRQVWRVVADYQQRPGLWSRLGVEVTDVDNPLATQLKQLKVVRVNDTHTLSDEVSKFLATLFPGAWLLVPLHFQGSLWGSLMLSMEGRPYQWQDSEVELVCAFAAQLAIAIQQSELYQQVQQLNANLEHQVQERTRALQQALDFEAMLKRVTDKVRDSLDESQILQTAVQELALGLEVGCCDAALYDVAQGTSTICYEYTISMPTSQGRVRQLVDFPEIYGQLLQGQYFQFCKFHAVRNWVSILACPIFDDRGVLGDLWVFKQKDNVFNELEIRLVQQVANQCAIAIRQARLYQAAQTQVAELEKLNRLKDDFLSTVSHELRTPVSNMNMAIQMLEMVSNHDSLFSLETANHQVRNSQFRRYFKILKDECDREMSLINDLLDLQHLEAGTQPAALTLIQLQNWIPHVVEPFEERARNQQLLLRVDISPELPAIATDLSSLQRVLTELLNNALKYTLPGEQIAVTASARSERLLLSVSNTGVEIPKSELSHIFEKFYRIPNADPWKHGGTGLGLALVKKLIEYLGGSISVQSDRTGTCFTVDLPLN
ncbi:MAG: PAS domain S-box protein [Aphanothece sp. CMT-3BRIN-NPC111]|jgi:PAS domain S-box-containing protein|nr:PAS domain S-box protein [Aphanothece sp. CMT-3BRIN-NPC111]